jgi:hypothetical protein
VGGIACFRLFVLTGHGERHRARRPNRPARTWLILVLTLGLSLLPVGLVLADPPDHSHAGGNQQESSAEEETPPPGEEQPPEDPAEGEEAPAPGPSDGNGQGNHGSGGNGSGGEEAPPSDDASTDGAATDDGGSSKEKTARERAEEKTKPPGNNGTIKVDGVEFDDHPNNEPHVGCTFQIDFYGYDEGDLFATATFELHPPTTSPTGDDLLLHDTDIFIGEDEAGGGTDLDASVTYDLEEALAASGATPHPIQGYHVKLTVHAEGSIGADVKHKVFWVKCGEDVGGQEIEVTKVWLEEGQEVDPPSDLPGSFRIVITGEGPNNTGTLTCRVTEGALACQGDLVINDPDEALTVTELNAPEGWAGPDEAFAECAEFDQDECVRWEIRIENVFLGGQQTERRFEVTKIWRGPGGDTTTFPPGVPEDLEIIFEDDEGNQLVCTRDGDEFTCEGFVDVEDGEQVSVTEEPEVEGWLGPDTATASCATTIEDDVEVTTCTFEVVNLAEVGGVQEIRRIVKVWLDEDGNEVGVPADLPAGFTLILEDPDEGGRLECVYEGANLACTGQIHLEDGETLIVDEENAPEGWSGPQSVPVDCVIVEGEEGTITTCTVQVVNEFVGGGRPPEVSPGGPITPPLAVTGIEAEGLLALALVLLAAGAAILGLERRRRRATP